MCCAGAFASDFNVEFNVESLAPSLNQCRVSQGLQAKHLSGPAEQAEEPSVSRKS